VDCIAVGGGIVKIHETINEKSKTMLTINYAGQLIPIALLVEGYSVSDYKDQRFVARKVIGTLYKCLSLNIISE
jgi:hypothetical protein